MLPDGYRYLGDGTHTRNGPCRLAVRLFQSVDGAFGFQAEAHVDDLPEFEKVEASGAGYSTIDEANIAAIEELQRILTARIAAPATE